MLNRFCKKPLWEVTRRLARVAMATLVSRLSDAWRELVDCRAFRFVDLFVE